MRVPIAVLLAAFSAMLILMLTVPTLAVFNEPPTPILIDLNIWGSFTHDGQVAMTDAAVSQGFSVCVKDIALLNSWKTWATTPATTMSSPGWVDTATEAWRYGTFDGQQDGTLHGPFDYSFSDFYEYGFNLNTAGGLPAYDSGTPSGSWQWTLSYYEWKGPGYAWGPMPGPNYPWNTFPPATFAPYHSIFRGTVISWSYIGGKLQAVLQTDGFYHGFPGEGTPELCDESKIFYLTYNSNTKTGVLSLTPPPVGGVWIPMNKFELLAPWIGLASIMTVAAASMVYIKRKKRKNN